MTEVDFSQMTTEEALAHYGVKGMKWGKRKSGPSASEIKEARLRLAGKTTAMNRQRIKIAKATVTGDKTTRKRAKSTLAGQRTKFLKDPDRPTALRMTNGEKAVNALFGNAANIAVSSIASRVVENRQKRGYYDTYR